jgi:hypothetical protein
MIPVADLRPLATEAGSAVQAGGSRPGAARPAPAPRCGPRKSRASRVPNFGSSETEYDRAGEAAPAPRHDSEPIRDQLVVRVLFWSCPEQSITCGQPEGQ